jgi:hypothetical protein
MEVEAVVNPHTQDSVPARHIDPRVAELTCRAVPACMPVAAHDWGSGMLKFALRIHALSPGPTAFGFFVDWDIGHFAGLRGMGKGARGFLTHDPMLTCPFNLRRRCPLWGVLKPASRGHTIGAIFAFYIAEPRHW